MDISEQRALEKKREYPVVKSNDIIQRARDDLNLQELKTMAVIFSMIKPTDKPGTMYDISIREYCRICGIDEKSGSNYTNAKKRIKALADKSFYVMQEDGREKIVRWLWNVELSRSKSRLTVSLDPLIEKYVHNLIGNFTQYTLIYTLPMQSEYSFRLYELLKSYAGLEEKYIDIDELKKKMIATHYEKFGMFRLRALEPAIKEINKYTDLMVTWEPSKDANRIEGLTFFIRTKTALEQVTIQADNNKQLDGQMNLSDYMNEQGFIKFTE